jgi:mannose-6-phosphate isomerase-like protein (cupin superfamily)
MTNEENRVRVVQREAAPTVEVLGERLAFLVTSADTGGVYAVLHGVTPPGRGTPVHRHRREDEGFLILDGEYEIRLGDRVVRAKTGDFVFAPRGLSHIYRNVGMTPGRIQVIISPAGFEQFFVDVARMTAGGRGDMAQVVALARDKFEVEFLASPPPVG